ncbi:hypothetical protein ACFU66_40980, partial [Streptomyces libani]
MIWSSEHVARNAVRRQGAGRSVARVAGAVAEAAVREREAAEELRSPGPTERGLVASDPEEFASMWAVRHAEWRRVQALMEASGWSAHKAERDSAGSAWAAARVVQPAGPRCSRGRTPWRFEGGCTAGPAVMAGA